MGTKLAETASPALDTASENPELTLRESIRVLKRGGILHMEMPNFLSY